MIFLKKNKHLFLVFIIIFFVFYPITNFKFVDYDDYLHLKKIKNFSIDDLVFFWLKPFEGLYMPVSYNIRQLIVLVFELFSQKENNLSKFFHTFSLIVHLINVYLVFNLLNEISRKKDQTALAALFFGLHPIQVESIAWVSQIGILIGFSFAMFSIYSYKKYVYEDKYSFYVLSIIFFLMSVLSKPNYVIVPLVLIVLFFKKEKIKTIFLTIIPYVVISYFLYRITKAEQIDKKIHFEPDYLDKFNLVISNILFYIHKIFVPIKLVPDYGIKFKDYNNDANFISCIIISIVILALMIKYYKSFITKGFVIFIIGLLPVLGFSTFMFQNISLVADRYVYLSVLGISFIIANYNINLNCTIKKIILIMVFLLITVKSSYQIMIWKNTPILLKSILKVNNRSSLAHNNLGLHLKKKKKYNLANYHFSEAIKNNKNALLAYKNRGNLRFLTKDYKGAIYDFTKFIQKKPNNKEIFYKRGISKEMLGFDGYKDIKKAASMNYNKANLWLKENQ